MPNYALVMNLNKQLDDINRYITRCNGILINYSSCVAERVLVIRCSPVYFDNIILYIQNKGFMLSYKKSGMQLYIYINGYMN